MKAIRPKEVLMDDHLHDDVDAAPPEPVAMVNRRDAIKLSVGAVTAALAGAQLQAQGSRSEVAAPVPRGSMPPPDRLKLRVGPGYRYTANRLGHNGPMDDTTRKVVKFVSEYGATSMSDATIKGVNRTTLDSIAAILTGFEEEPVRIAARMAQMVAPNGLKSTVLGYGITTTPELATFANSCLVRATDFNDNGDGGHDSDLIPAALAMGEALHASGADVMAAIVIGYEVKAAPAGGESVAAAMAAGKLMKLDEDRLANALSIALTPHVALNKGVGAMSMWKGVRSAEAMKCGMWAALLAREGMTGPPQPFEGRGALWSRNGRGREFTMPIRGGQMAIERNWFKRRPAEASSQGTLLLIPEMRAWAKPEEIEQIDYYMNTSGFGEIGDAPKWDPRNRETADHSMPCIFARAFLDGDIYADSFTEQKFMDPAARALMNKMIVTEVREWTGLGPARIIIRKRSGETRTWDTYNGARNLTIAEYPHFSDEEVLEKFNRAAAYAKVDDAQRDRARRMWGNLREVKDIGEAIQTLARFGQPRPLSA
jgi:2-methylcitrate dehydratase